MFSEIENILDLSKNKQNVLSKIQNLNKKCKKCSIKEHYEDYDAVPGTGNPEADIMLIGEAPGKNEMEEGIPFVGRAGKLLDSAIEQAGIKRDDLYIHNIISCRPHKNKFPYGHDGVSICKQWLVLEVSIIKPKVILAVGGTAYKILMDRPNAYITQIRGEWETWVMENINHKVWFAGTLHPSYCMRRHAMGDDESTDFLIKDLENAQKMINQEFLV
jgi:DNA polymerase